MARLFTRFTGEFASPEPRDRLSPIDSYGVDPEWYVGASLIACRLRLVVTFSRDQLTSPI
jgi:hypothetical protein